MRWFGPQVHRICQQYGIVPERKAPTQKEVLAGAPVARMARPSAVGLAVGCLLLLCALTEGFTITRQNCRLSGYVAPWKRCGGRFRRKCCHSGSKCSVKDKDTWICKYRVPSALQNTALCAEAKPTGLEQRRE